MNPLGLVPERFTVAVGADGTLLGFGQLEQKDSYVELRSMIVEPSVRHANFLTPKNILQQHGCSRMPPLTSFDCGTKRIGLR